jgi:hypothetical protein
MMAKPMARPKASPPPPAGRDGPGNEEPLLLALACGATVEAAAQKAGLSARSVYRRLKRPAFRRRLAERRAELVRRASAALSAAGLEAVKTLLALLGQPTPPATRLGAARSVLELGVKLRDLTEVEERLRRLEARLARREAGRRGHRGTGGPP